MAKKSKLRHLSTPPISQEKSHTAPIFGFVRSLDQGVLLHKATGEVDSPHSYETCLFNGPTDRRTDGLTPLNSYLTSSAELKNLTL
jgi:hypothetical protein